LPLYWLGFMGMTRRLSYYDNPEWNTWLLIAGAGALVILLGICVQFYQIFASIRDRHKNQDLTGDPWNGRTLEWATASPPPFYNFAHVPSVDDRDAFHNMKERGENWQANEQYHRIHMPKNTGAGVIISGFALVFGFAMVWHIWWLAILGTLGMIGTWIAYSFVRSKDHYVSAEEVAAIEAANKARSAQDPDAPRRENISVAA